jgi:hypothetical protein
MDTTATKELNHGSSAHDASHPAFRLRKEAFVWDGDRAAAPNLVPLAAELKEWLGRRRSHLSLHSRLDAVELPYSNPYTFHASSIAASLMHIINSANDFACSGEALNPFEAEVTRLRLHTELVLYVPRFCEATMKQLLYCTDIPRRLYAKASLGGLLSVDCDRCRKAFKQDPSHPTHSLSLLGALAHRYFLCHTLETCVYDHLALVGKTRNVQAAHSDALDLNIRDAEASRADLAETLRTVGYGLGHMADHLGDIELRMLGELELRLASFPGMPKAEQLMNAWVRPGPDEIEAARQSHITASDGN